MADVEDVIIKAFDVFDHLITAVAEESRKKLRAEREARQKSKPSKVPTAEPAGPMNHACHPGPCAIQVLSCFYPREEAVSIALEHTCFPLNCDVAARQALVFLVAHTFTGGRPPETP